MSGPGIEVFHDGVAQLGARASGGGTCGSRLRALAERLGRPVTVAVRGRGGAGVSTVAAALSAAGIQLGGPDADADAEVLVLTEVAKPEDIAAIRDASRPGVVVVNKADLSGFGGGGPLATAAFRCAELAVRTGAIVEPMAALLAVAAMEPGKLADDMVDDLRILIAEPADLSSPDAFVVASHRLPRADRQRLVDRLDLFGIAHCVVALRDDRNLAAGGLRGVLRRLSRIDAVCARIDAAVAEVRYLRLTAAAVELRALAIGDDGVADFLESDQAVLARMAAAVEVVQTAGVGVDPGDEPIAHRRRAVRWRHYGAGPVTALHRACAADITRGSLRLLAGGRA